MADSQFHDETGAEIDSVFEEVAAAEVAAAPAPASAAGADPGLDQVREILLGQQTRQLEQRLTASEQRVERAIAEMQAEAGRRMEALESSIKDELGSLIETLGAQREERSAQYKSLTDEIERVSTESATTIAELTKRLETFGEELETRALELSNEISEETAQLRGELVDRAAMASVFSELSLKLSAAPAGDVPQLDTGDETEAMLGELLGGEGA